MTKIKFGTDGWRAIIAKDFTVDNVARVTEATAKWMLTKEKKPTVVLGHDCRFAGELFAETSAKVFIAAGIKVFLAKDFISTPMISLGAVKLKTSLGIIITASHNPPSYNGYKIKGSYGGPLGPEKVQEIEDTIPEKATYDWNSVDLKNAEAIGLLEIVALEDMYIKHVEENFDLKAIKNSGLSFAYDAMYGAGQRVMQRLFPEIHKLHCDNNPGFHGQAPEPIHKNLIEFSEYIKKNGKISCGLATDGDADRIGLYDSKGNFVDSHHIILLLIHYLVKYKNQKGKVAVAFSTTVKIKNMCEHYGLPLDVVKIGFKYICNIMITEDVLVGGEESGGIAIKGHIPERDGIWMGLVIWEFMAKTGKSLNELIEEVYAITGTFCFDRNDLHINDEIKNKVLANCKSGAYKEIGKFKVSRVDDLDGYKFFFDENTWMMIRASGTEPVLRVYAEAANRAIVDEILASAKKVLLG
ncbi:phosphoglucomutase/phosphomannomutase family protein [Aurantibacillus circumpalustris]|uniref:phosphoglucomutase/phosphomannomutase family protein n=1 Tax=Aurantibacillus circumpalustris TaxID=3036359 RepID=UPI00295B2FEA|nr:phosphoglucomutase/phosphomannomutase family protein [Aurantibacillus circumpalustris]